MNARSLTTRVMRGTVFVALATALAGAATATLIARGLWQAQERRALRDLAAGLAGAVAREAAEEGGTLDAAVSEALRESVPAGHHAEVWRGTVLVASSPAGSPLGPPAESRPTLRDAWLVEVRPLPGGLILLVATPRERVSEALRIFGWSLLLSAPVCVVLAVLTGRVVGRRAARPLLELTSRIAAARPFEALPQGSPPDVLEVKEMEASFRALWDRLRQAMAREIEFAANAAHELRTPLTRIRLRAERAGAAAGAASSRELRELIEEIDRVVRLVDSLLVLARDAAAGIPAGETVNVSDVAAAAARRVFAGGAPPLFEAPDETLVRGDESLLGIAVENLLDNARKFSSPGRPPRVVVDGGGAGVRLTVTSPGTRIPFQDAERLFERFYRGAEARASFSGHGLGLPLARHIARLHGGDLRCVSGPDEEACFELSLPAWHPLPREGPAAEERS
jgi:two-component system, OmpR family, sensor kinase